jgi:hypothetical protein
MSGYSRRGSKRQVKTAPDDVRFTPKADIRQRELTVR